MRQRTSIILAAFLALAWAGAASGGIAIPGFDALTFAAGTTEQDVELFNPAGNECVFKITLALEDGTALWESGPIRPGESVNRITLSRPLDAGTYPAALSYHCYSARDGTPLNGAEIKLKIEVK